jgi:hypothetical protein
LGWSSDKLLINLIGLLYRPDNNSIDGEKSSKAPSNIRPFPDLLFEKLTQGYPVGVYVIGKNEFDVVKCKCLVIPAHLRRTHLRENDKFNEIVH